MDNKVREEVKAMNKTGVERALESGKEQQNDRIISELEAKGFNIVLFLAIFFWVILMIMLAFSLISSGYVSSLLGF